LDRAVVLVMHTTSYGAAGFAEACRRAGARVMVASDRCHILDRVWQWPSDAIVIDFSDPERAAATIADAATDAIPPVRAVLPVGGEIPARVAASAARRLGLAANGPDAMIAAANKLVMRERLAAAVSPPVVQPRFVAVPRSLEPARVAALVGAPGGVGFPCVVKPLMLTGSRGVIRADDPQTLVAALERLGRLLDDPAVARIDPQAARRVLVEAYVPGPEVALEGLLSYGNLEVLAIYDKPDPLEGPFFEETIYVTPSRLGPEAQERIVRATAAAARALGLETGSLHAEIRLGDGAPVGRVGTGELGSTGPVAGGSGNPPRGPVVIELAARSIGGLCSRTLTFDGGLTLEDVVVRHALGGWPPPARERRPSGVMMIPIPARVPSVLREVGGLEEARAVPGVSELVISARVGETVVPLPEGASYLGFIFADADHPSAVEAALRAAAARLRFSFAPLMPVAGARGATSA
jgi:biotin carboxylase